MRHHFPMPKVYSYTRFSTPEQAQGDSFRRQTEAAREFAAKHGLVLDETLSIADPGVSAFRGANLGPEAGLGKFLDAVRSGLVEEGSILLIESLDRLSRMEPLDVQHELTGLLRAGVNVATLADGRVYSRETLKADNGLGLMIALMVAVRAHEESATKGRRVAAAWAEKRRKVRAGEATRLTSKGPLWLVPEGEGWRIDPDRAATVQRVFSMTLAGLGEHKIAETLNREGVPVFGRGQRWHRSTVAKLLRNRAVIGDLVPGHIEHPEGRKKRVAEEPVAGAFPPVIGDADWLAVRSLKDGTSAATRGRAAGAPLANVLAGLARCPLCGSAMTRVYKGRAEKAGKPKLVCTRAKAGAGCEYHSIPLPEVEAAIFGKPWFALDNIPAGPAGAELDREAGELASTIAGTLDHLHELADALEGNPSKAGARRLAQLEAELDTLQAALADLEERRRLADHGLIHARADRLYEAIAEREGDDREPINAAMRVLFSGVVVDFTMGRLRFQWKQGGETDLPYGSPFPPSDPQPSAP